MCWCQVVAPKKESLAEAESSYNAMMEKLNAKRLELDLPSLAARLT